MRCVRRISSHIVKHGRTHERTRVFSAAHVQQHQQKQYIQQQHQFHTTIVVPQMTLSSSIEYLNLYDHYIDFGEYNEAEHALKLFENRSIIVKEQYDNNPSDEYSEWNYLLFTFMIHIMKGKLCVVKNDLQQALIHYDQVLLLEPKLDRSDVDKFAQRYIVDPIYIFLHANDACFTKCSILCQMKQEEKAIPLLTFLLEKRLKKKMKQLKSTGTHPEAMAKVLDTLILTLILRSKSFVILGRFKEAMKDINSGLKYSDPSHQTNLIAMKLEILLASEKIDEFVELFPSLGLTYLDYQPDCKGLAIEYVYLLVDKKRCDEALNQLQLLHEYIPVQSKHELLCQIYLNLNRYEECIHEYEQYEQLVESPEQLLSVVDCYLGSLYSTAREKEMIAYCDRLLSLQDIAIEKDAVEFSKMLGSVYYSFKLSQYHEAIDQLQHMLLTQSEKNPAIKLVVPLTISSAYISLERYSDAIESLITAEHMMDKTDFKYGLCLKSKAVSLYGIGKYNEYNDVVQQLELFDTSKLTSFDLFEYRRSILTLKAEIEAMGPNPKNSVPLFEHVLQFSKTEGKIQGTVIDYLLVLRTLIEVEHKYKLDTPDAVAHLNEYLSYVPEHEQFARYRELLIVKVK
jgi:tetratricopeptide (TPR) repeat protein